MSEAEQMINDCVKRSDKLSDWEREFLSSIETIVARKKLLTSAQQNILDKIWEKATTK